MIYVEGAFKTRKYQDQSGNDRYSSECVVQGIGGKVVLLGGKREQSDSREPEQHSQSDYDDDPIPF